MGRRKEKRTNFFSVGIFIAASATLFLTTQLLAADWKMFGKDISGSRNQPDTIFSTANAGSLVEKWKFTSPFSFLGVFGGVFIKNPAVDSDYIYATDSYILYKLSKAGILQWSRPLSSCFPFFAQSQTSPALAGGKVILGINDPFFGNGAWVLAVDRDTGACGWKAQVDNHPLSEVTGSPTVHGNSVYVGTGSSEENAAANASYPCCSFRGQVCRLDATSGGIVWCTSMVDPEGDPAISSDDKTEAQLAGYAGAAVWTSPIALDMPENLVIVTTGNLYSRGTYPEAPQAPSDVLNPFHISFDAFVALDINTGEKRWVAQTYPSDIWNRACVRIVPGSDPANCPDDVGPDYDCSAGPTFMKNVQNFYGHDINGNGKPEPNLDMVGANCKSGLFYAVETTTGKFIYPENPDLPDPFTNLPATQVGPSTLLGLGGAAYDGNRIYMSNVDFLDFNESAAPITRAWPLKDAPYPNTGKTACGGTVTALDPATGNILWQNAGPAGFPENFSFPTNQIMCSLVTPSPALAPVTSANGVVFFALAYPNPFWEGFFGFPPLPTDPTNPVTNNMFALDGATGDILWSHSASDPVISGPAVVDDLVIWGSGGFPIPFPSTAGTLHVFGLP